MADTAFDPFPPTEGEVQLAQAPPQRTFDPWANSPPPQQAPVPQQQQQAQPPALNTGAPPAATPGVAGPVAQPPKQVWGDEDDKRELKLSDDEEKKTYTDNVLSHRNFQPLVTKSTDAQKQRVLNHPMGKDMKDLYALIDSGKMNKEEQRRYKAAADRMAKQINADLNAEDKTVREQNQLELRQIDAHYEDATKRDQTAGTISGHVDTKSKETEAAMNHRDPETARKAKWDYQVSPLSTMSKKATPDGKANYVALRDAVTSIAMLNKISNEKALDLTLAIGSPVGYDDKTGEWVRGANGKRGAGATFYQPLGVDMNGNAIIRVHNTTLRVPMETMQQLKTARGLGYNAAKKFRADEEAAKQPGWVGRQLEKGAKALGIQ